MRIQPIITPSKQKRFILLDENGLPVELANAFLKSVDPLVKPKTLRLYAYSLLQWFRFLEASGIDPLDIYDPADPTRPKRIIGQFITFLGTPEQSMLSVEGHAPCRHAAATINQYKRVVVMFYEFLQDEGVVSKDFSFRRVVKRYTRSTHIAAELFRVKPSTVTYGNLPVQQKPIGFITRDQYISIFKVLDSERDRLALALMFESAMRMGEVLGLHWEDLSNIGQGLIRIEPRNDNENEATVKRAGGYIPTPGYVVDMILALEASVPENIRHGFVFMSERRGKYSPLQYQALYKKLKAAAKKVGIDFHPHMLRHGFVVEKLGLEEDKKAIQAVLRHKHWTTTLEMYGHLEHLIKSGHIADKVKNARLRYGGIPNNLMKDN